jgi:hypothetical protein
MTGGVRMNGCGKGRPGRDQDSVADPHVALIIGDSILLSALDAGS